MKKIITVLSLLVVSTSAFAGNQNICRDKFLNLIGVNVNQSNLDVTKKFVGKIKSSNFSDETAGQCIVDVQYYQPETPPGSIYLDFKNSILMPFNHYVEADNNPRNCSSNGDSSKVSGSSEFTEDSGWHHHYSTELTLSKNADGSLTMSYQQEDDKLTCVGSFQ